MTPSQETCKRLTLYLGKCDRNCISCIHSPSKCGNYLSFTTSADLFAVYGKMVERGNWPDFRTYAVGCYVNSESYSPFGSNAEAMFTAWLFCLNAPSQIGERMEMAGKWLGEVKNGSNR